MTATLPKIPDPLVVLRRAEQKHTGEEPGDLDHLADAVRAQIIAPLAAGGAPVVDDVQVKQLLADKQRLGDLAEELRKQAETRGNVIERQTRDLVALKRQLDELRQALATRDGEIDEARAERDTARAQLRDRPPPGVDTSVLDQAQRDNARLADELGCARRDLAAANRTLDEIADEEPATAHVHYYPVAGPGEEAQPCSCGQPYPRSYTGAEVEEIVPDVEPWGDLFGRIRDQITEAGWTA